MENIISSFFSPARKSLRLLIIKISRQILVKKNFESKKPQEPKSFAAFLKKRAPIYLGLLGLFFVFAYPAITEKNLDSFLENSFEGDEKIAFDMVMNYAGENGTGLKIKEVIEEKINDKYPDQKIFDHEDTRVNISVEKYEPGNATLFNYQVEFLFYPKGNSDFELNYGWLVNIETGLVSWDGPNAKNIVQMVEYAD